MLLMDMENLRWSIVDASIYINFCSVLQSDDARIARDMKCDPVMTLSRKIKRQVKGEV